jgi:hypothetical protein
MRVTVDVDSPMTPARALNLWIAVQTLKPVATPGYDPAEHGPALDVLGELLVADRTLASGKVSDALKALMANPQMGTAELSGTVFGGSAGYTLHVMWPLVSIFTGRMPRKVAGSTGKSYVGWVDRIRRVVMRGMPLASVDGVSAVLDAVSDAYTSAVVAVASPEMDAGRLVEVATERVDTDEPGIYVFTTPTYLAHPPFGWNTEDLARVDFRYLNVGSTTVDDDGLVVSGLSRQDWLPEPYIILATFRAAEDVPDYLARERQIHRLLSEARHGPEKDGTQRALGQGAGTGWFITRLPFILAVAEALGLELAMSEDLKAGVNEMLSACQLTDWTLG